jgi:hypothetical protein
MDDEAILVFYSLYEFPKHEPVVQIIEIRSQASVSDGEQRRAPSVPKLAKHSNTICQTLLQADDGNLKRSSAKALIHVKWRAFGEASQVIMPRPHVLWVPMR